MTKEEVSKNDQAKILSRNTQSSTTKIVPTKSTKKDEADFDTKSSSVSKKTLNIKKRKRTKKIGSRIRQRILKKKACRTSSTSVSSGRSTKSVTQLQYETTRSHSNEEENIWLYNIPNKNAHKWSVGDFRIGKTLGRGKYGCVYRATKTNKDCSDDLALKIMTKKKILSCKVTPSLIKREVEIQSMLNHNNILKLFGYFHDHTSIYLVLEEAKRGDLHRKVMSMCKHHMLEDNVASNYIYQIAKAIQYLQKQHVSHRDIKPENILLVEDGTLKLGDFGWAVHAPPPNRNFRRTLCGTPEYVPPEMLLGTMRSGFYEAKYVDIWALGVLAYEMKKGKTMFCTKCGEQGKIFEKIKRFCEVPFDWKALGGTKSNSVPLFARFVSAIIRPNPKQRLDIESILKHDWLQRYNKSP